MAFMTPKEGGEEGMPTGLAGVSGVGGDDINRLPRRGSTLSPAETQSRSGSSSESESDRSFDSDSSEGETASAFGWAASSQAAAGPAGGEGSSIGSNVSFQDLTSTFAATQGAPSSTASSTAGSAVGISQGMASGAPSSREGSDVYSKSLAEQQAASGPLGAAPGDSDTCLREGTPAEARSIIGGSAVVAPQGSSAASKQAKRLLQHKRRQEKLNVKTLKLYSKIAYRMTKITVILETAPCTTAPNPSSQQQQNLSSSGTGRARSGSDSAEVKTKQTRKLAKLMCVCAASIDDEHADRCS